MSAHPIRLAIVVSHPIQHFCSLYAYLSEHPDLRVRVVFGDFGGAKAYFDEGFGRMISFADTLGIERFDHRILAPDSGESGNLRTRLWKTLGEFDADAVAVYGVTSELTRGAWLWSLRYRRSRFYISDSEDRAGNRRWTREIASRLLAAPVLRTMTALLSVGDANAEYYRRRFVSRRRIARVPFPVDVGPLDAATDDDRREVRDNIGAGPNDVLILTVGKLQGIKGQAELIRAVSSTSERALLAIVGSGELMDELVQLAAKLDVRCLFPGFVSPAQLPAWYRAADLYVQPSSIDHHSLSVSEAVYMGLPVIVTDRTGSWGESDDVQDGRNGFVYRSGDEAELALHLTSLIENRDLRARMATASRSIGAASQHQAYEGFATTVIERARLNR